MIQTRVEFDGGTATVSESPTKNLGCCRIKLTQLRPDLVLPGDSPVLNPPDGAMAPNTVRDGLPAINEYTSQQGYC